MLSVCQKIACTAGSHLAESPLDKSDSIVLLVRLGAKTNNTNRAEGAKSLRSDLSVATLLHSPFQQFQIGNVVISTYAKSQQIGVERSL